MPVSWTDYKGQKNLYVDYRNLIEKDAIMDNLEDQKKIIEKESEPVLVLADYRDMHIFDEFLGRVKKYGKEHKSMTKKIAVLGITGMKKIFFNTYVKFTGDSNIKAFDTEEKAKEFLIN